MSKKEGKALKSLKSSGRRGESVQENRTYVERLVRRIVEHVSYREAVRSEPKIIECLELYQQDLWEGEHCKREASQAEKKVAGASTSARASGTKKKRGGATNASRERGLKARERKKAADSDRGADEPTAKRADKHSGVYNFGALMKQAKTLQEFETTGKKPKAKKKERKRPDTIDSPGFRERSASVVQTDSGAFSAKKTWGKARRLSLPTHGSRTDYRAARYNSSHDASGNPLQPAYPFANPNIFSLAGCGSNQLLQRVLYLACQQNETIKFEKKVRKERERTSQMPVLASSVHIQLLCSKEDGKEKSKSESSWNSYF